MRSSDTELHYLYRLSPPRAQSVAPGRHELARERYIEQQTRRRELEIRSELWKRRARPFRWVAGLQRLKLSTALFKLRQPASQ